MEKEEKKELTRREFLTWAATIATLLAIPGCAPQSPPAAYSPPAGSRVRPVTEYAYASTDPQPPPTRYVYVQQVQAPAPAPAQRRVVSRASGGKLNVMSRNSWGATAAIPAKMKPMNGVSRITIHHEGSAKPNTDNTPVKVAATLRLIQSQHRARLGAGDIGYHFIIDRSGAIWQGRDWMYQGAHTSGNNGHNIGVMLLGNFELQQPTAEQIDSMHQLVANLCRKFNLNQGDDIFGHCDFVNTQCPGKNLKPYVQGMRRRR